MVRNGKAFNIDDSGGQNSYALAMADNGVIVGSYAKGPSENIDAWSPVTGINSRGELVGNGVFNGQSRAFVLRPQ